MTKSVDLVMFDLAGTTVRDDGFVLRAFRQTADEAKLSPTDEWLRSRMGQYKLHVFAELLRAEERNESEAAHLTTRFDEWIADGLRKQPPVALPGAESSIHHLREVGVRIGFTTGFTTSTADAILQQLGWRFDVSVASDQVERGRPHPHMIQLGMKRTGVSDPRRVAAVGDTPSDMQAGTAAGCAFVIGVGCGTHTLAELAKHPHTHLIPDLTTLIPTLGM